MTKEKEEIKAIWKDQILTAKEMAGKAILKNPSDYGTCNFDEAMIEKEKHFTYAETIQIFKECGLSASKYKNGMLLVGGIHGQAEKNTLWAKTFSYWLGEQGFKASMYYQCD